MSSPKNKRLYVLPALEVPNTQGRLEQVIDDVWNPAHLWPFLWGGKGCARLVTTRQFEVAAEAKRVNVDEMTTGQAVEMLIAGLQPRPADRVP